MTHMSVSSAAAAPGPVEGEAGWSQEGTCAAGGWLVLAPGKLPEPVGLQIPSQPQAPHLRLPVPISTSAARCSPHKAFLRNFTSGEEPPGRTRLCT